ncbi:uncharacterized protein LOC123911048 [Trifolium pratense]|uniref:uncharacterized protein LOC123911048 n=1 Tax=Trifolium pratense TaxID=57577 RepID=UPI001E690F5A|nr:uncharacterized protein LOC123911048 [Trifolium pratense]
MSIIVIIFGILSFILGIIGEVKKPSKGVLVQGKNAMICNYPNDPTVVFGYSSIGFLVASSLMGFISIFYSYNRITVPPSALFKNTTLSVFLILAMTCSILGGVMTLWPTVTEQHHWRHNFYSANITTTSTKLNCPTAKTGLMGGGAFLCLISSLFWLSSLMLVKNAREDYLEEVVPPNV